MEYIQADIWVRFQRMQGHEVHFVGADDAHGAPIMIAAEKAGKTPQQFVGDIAAGRKRYLDGFHIEFDNWHSTDSPENTELSQDIYKRLKAAGLIYVKPVEQFYDPVKGMFLADRYIKGECPKCGAKDQYGDACEVCSSVYAPTELKNPYSTLSGAAPELRTSDHYFFKLSDTKCVSYLNEWLNTTGRLQPQVSNKAREWLDGSGDQAMKASSVEGCLTASLQSSLEECTRVHRNRPMHSGAPATRRQSGTPRDRRLAFGRRHAQPTIVHQQHAAGACP